MRGVETPGWRQESQVGPVSGECVPRRPLLVDLREHVGGVLEQHVEDAVRQLHLHKQLVLVVVDPLGLFLVELLDLREGRHRWLVVEGRG